MASAISPTGPRKPTPTGGNAAEAPDGMLPPKLFSAPGSGPWGPMPALQRCPRQLGRSRPVMPRLFNPCVGSERLDELQQRFPVFGREFRADHPVTFVVAELVTPIRIAGK